jgi:hypothetical protein
LVGAVVLGAVIVGTVGAGAPVWLKAGWPNKTVAVRVLIARHCKLRIASLISSSSLT